MSHPMVVHVKSKVNSVYCGRGSRFGNPFPMYKEGDRGKVVKQFNDWLIYQPELLRLSSYALKGKKISCFCAPKDCHCDTLAQLPEESSPWIIPGTPVYLVFSTVSEATHDITSTEIKAGVLSNSELTHLVHWGELSVDGLPDDIRNISCPISEMDSFLKIVLSYPEHHFNIMGQVPATIHPDALNTLCSLSNVTMPGLYVSGAKRVLIMGLSRPGERSVIHSRISKILMDMPDCEIVTVGANGIDRYAEEYAINRKHRLRRIPAMIERFPSDHELIHHIELLTYSTHLIVFDSNPSPILTTILEMAKKIGVKTRLLKS